jgi:hypothetical protein
VGRGCAGSFGGLVGGDRAELDGDVGATGVRDDDVAVDGEPAVGAQLQAATAGADEDGVTAEVGGPTDEGVVHIYAGVRHVAGDGDAGVQAAGGGAGGCAARGAAEGHTKGEGRDDGTREWTPSRERKPSRGWQFECGAHCSRGGHC